MRLDNVELDGKDGGSWNLMLDPVPVTQWSLFAVCLFFCTGHWFVICSLPLGFCFFFCHYTVLLNLFVFFPTKSRFIIYNMAFPSLWTLLDIILPFFALLCFIT